MQASVKFHFSRSSTSTSNNERSFKMKINSLLEVESCSNKARVIAYLLPLIPIAYFAVAVVFVRIAVKHFDYRFIAMSQSEGGISVQIPSWILSVFCATLCVYASKVTWSCFVRFRDTKTFYVFKRAMRKGRKEMKLGKTPNFDDFLEALGDKSPKPRKGVLRYVDDLLPW